MEFSDIKSAIAIIDSFSENLGIHDDLAVVTNAFRYLRNLCATNSESQSAIAQNIKIVTSSRKILLQIISSEIIHDDHILCLNVGLQFLANFLVYNRKNQQIVWSDCQELLEKGVAFNNKKVQHCCLMIIYNIFLGNFEILSNIKCSYENIIELATDENSSEYANFILDFFAVNSKYLERFYDKLKVKLKLVILDEIQRMTREQSAVAPISCDTIKFLVNQFSHKADWILNTIQSNDDFLKVVEVVKLLEILVTFSCDDDNKYLEILQQETSFYINCVALLKAVHALSKEGKNNFTMLTKLSEISESETIDSGNPVFGFKGMLIRIVGNLSWKNKKFQDIIRDLEGIQVILDCCVIDARNPFITQWSILAIHNICEKNQENQEIIALMSKEGVIDAKSLQEIGSVLNCDANGDTLCIAPLKIQD